MKMLSSHRGETTDAASAKLELLVPSVHDARASMALQFELVRQDARRGDAVVGWTVFPLQRADSSIVDGQFKAPMLRGAVDADVVTYRQIESRIADDVDSWLCNLYFGVVHAAGDEQRRERVQARWRAHILPRDNENDVSSPSAAESNAATPRRKQPSQLTSLLGRSRHHRVHPMQEILTESIETASSALSTQNLATSGVIDDDNIGESSIAFGEDVQLLRDDTLVSTSETESPNEFEYFYSVLPRNCASTAQTLASSARKRIAFLWAGVRLSLQNNDSAGV
ncbi:MAG: hypothetical protein MHM6MM_002518 [Cercozoa sp. M6MM]